MLGLNTLEVIASQAPRDCSPLAVALDAQRQQFFAATLRHEPSGELVWAQPTQIVDIAQWLAARNADGWATGPVLEKLADRLPPGARCVDRRCWTPTAEAVGRLALRQFRAGRRGDPFQLTPEYFRRSAAEEKLEEMTKDGARRTKNKD